MTAVRGYVYLMASETQARRTAAWPPTSWKLAHSNSDRGDTRAAIYRAPPRRDQDDDDAPRSMAALRMLEVDITTVLWRRWLFGAKTIFHRNN